MVRGIGLILGTSFLLLGGCSKTPSPVPVEVKGKVQYTNGKPVTKMVLTLYPQEEINKMSPILSCPLGDKGEFSGKCLPGKYKGSLAPIPSGPGSAGTEPGISQVAPKELPKKASSGPYLQNPNQMTLEVIVPPEGKSDFVLIVR